MATLHWNEAYSVRIEEMDKQHRTLLDLLTKLGDCMVEGVIKDDFKDIVSELSRYANTHFKEEEDLLAKYDYPMLAAQQSMHQKYIARIADYEKKLGERDAALSLDILKFLTDWLINHIILEDKKYGTYLNEKGVA
jgi:hemerythrin